MYGLIIYFFTEGKYKNFKHEKKYTFFIYAGKHVNN